MTGWEWRREDTCTVDLDYPTTQGNQKSERGRGDSFFFSVRLEFGPFHMKLLRRRQKHAVPRPLWTYRPTYTILTD